MNNTIVAVAHAEDDLWCSVVASDNVGSHHETGTGRTRQTKVENLQSTVALDNNVGRLQILQQQQTQFRPANSSPTGPESTQSRLYTDHLSAKKKNSTNNQ